MKYVTYLQRLSHYIKFELASDEVFKSEAFLSFEQNKKQDFSPASLQNQDDAMMFIPPFVVEQMESAEANSDISGVTFVQGFSFEELSQIWKCLHVELSKYKSKSLDDVKFKPLK